MKMILPIYSVRSYSLSDTPIIARLALPRALEWKSLNPACQFFGTLLDAQYAIELNSNWI